jgi:class 3 adenylate cyclase
MRFEARARIHARPEQLWPLLADTPKLNRALGMPEVHYTALPASNGNAQLIAEVRLAGIPFARWIEHPFQWQEPYRYSVVREFAFGPIKRVWIGTDLRPEDGDTELLVFAELEGANRASDLLIKRVIGPRSVEAIVRLCRSFEQALQSGIEPYAQLKPTPRPADRLSAMVHALIERGQDETLADRLRNVVLTGRDDEVYRMRPFEVADRWQADRRAVLVLFLHATTVGLLTMSWDVLCPACRVGKGDVSTLRDLRTRAHCETCNITFAAQFDRLVEVRFTPSPSVRHVVHREYCIGGPRNTPHIVAQQKLAPGEQREVPVLLQPGDYHVRSPRAEHGTTLLVEDNASVDRADIRLAEIGFSPSTVVRAGPVRLRFTNETPAEAILVLERAEWPDTIATAAIVSTIQEFRDLFSSEVLAPGLELGIERLAFLFTDLAGSTAMYQRLGQARAFSMVQAHFRILTAQIAASQGAVVKTIGDAVMAAFPSGADALAAGLAIQRAIREFDAGEGIDPATLVRIGIHAGACLATTMNDRLDYFGTTVNIASRVEHEARGGQIVATTVVCDEPESAALLAHAQAALQPDVVHLRGIAEPVSVYRITPA